MVIIYGKSIFDAEESIIVNEVKLNSHENSETTLGIFKKFPLSELGYKSFLEREKNPLGAVQFIIIPKEKKIIANTFIEKYSEENPSSLEDITTCFLNLSVNVSNKIPIAIPYFIGCSREEDWEEVILPTIKEIFKNKKIFVYRNI